MSHDSPRPAPAGGVPGARNHVIDAARATAVLVVVVFHALLYRFTWDAAGPQMVPWAPDHALWWPLSWVFMIIPVFFVAGGFAHALLVDRMAPGQAGYAAFLAHRGRRLIGPLTLFVGVLATVATAAAWAGHLDAAVTLSRQLAQLLWFLAVYLVIIAAAPLAVRAHDRWGWRVLVAPAVLAAAVDAWSFAVGRYELRNLNMLLVWPVVHQLGIAYQRGWFRRGPVAGALLALAGGIGGIWTLVSAFGYPPSAVGFADIPIANVQPPTLAMVFLGLAQCGVLGLVERSGVLHRVPAWLERAMAVVNALMMSVYLWHILAIGLAALTLLEVARLLPAAAPTLLAQPVVALVTLGFVALLVPLIAQVELRLVARQGERLNGPLIGLAYALLTLGIVVVWLTGTVVHPASPASSLGVATTVAGVLLMRRAVRW